METAVKKRNNLFAKVKWEHEAAKNIRQRHPHPAELTERLDKLRKTREAFDEVQTEIEMGCDSEAIATIFNHRMEFEQIYYAVKTVYATILDDLRGPASDDAVASMPDDFKKAIKSLVESQERFLKAQATVSTNLGELAVQQRRSQAGSSSVLHEQPLNRDPNINLRLPVFTIPVFRGERKEWRAFKDLFETGIHNREDIGNALKLQYLLSYLDGEAKSLVSAFPISDANYEPAWTKLKEHYDKKKYIVYSLVRDFCDQPNVNKAATELSKLVSTSDEIVRQLQALGQQYTSRDPWLIHLLLEKLDEETRSLWAQKVVSIENPNFNEFLKFLQDRCDALETFSAFTKPPTEADSNVDVKKEYVKTTSTNEDLIQSFPVSTQQCAKCSTKDHSIYNCEAFRNLEVAARWEFVAKEHLCYNCLKGGHAVRNCPSSAVCKYEQCKQRHHTLLCQSMQAQQVSEDDGFPTKKDDTDSSTNTVVAYTGGLVDVPKRSSMVSITITMLPTAVVRIRGKNGLLHEARVLIDSGSQVSLISQDFAMQLAIPRRNARLVVTGLSQQAAGTTNGVVRLFISSRFSESVVLATDAYILGRLTAPLPRLELGEAQLRYLYDLNLADPLFHKPGPIDVILGADVFLSVIRDGQVMDNNNQSVAQNSAFGWIISGRLDDKANSEKPAVSLYSGIDMDKTLWMIRESQDLQTVKPFTPKEQRVMDHYEATHQRGEHGQDLSEMNIGLTQPGDRSINGSEQRQPSSGTVAVSRSCISSSRQGRKNPILRRGQAEFQRSVNKICPLLDD